MGAVPGENFTEGLRLLAEYLDECGGDGSSLIADWQCRVEARALCSHTTRDAERGAARDGGWNQPSSDRLSRRNLA